MMQVEARSPADPNEKTANRRPKEPFWDFGPSTFQKNHFCLSRGKNSPPARGRIKNTFSGRNVLPESRGDFSRQNAGRNGRNRGEISREISGEISGEILLEIYRACAPPFRLTFRPTFSRQVPKYSGPKNRCAIF